VKGADGLWVEPTEAARTMFAGGERMSRAFPALGYPWGIGAPLSSALPRGTTDPRLPPVTSKGVRVLSFDAGGSSDAGAPVSSLSPASADPCVVRSARANLEAGRGASSLRSPIILWKT
jgi:hypothetical protein